jgi:hypothetical protein
MSEMASELAWSLTNQNVSLIINMPIGAAKKITKVVDSVPYRTLIFNSGFHEYPGEIEIIIESSVCEFGADLKLVNEKIKGRIRTCDNVILLFVKKLAVGSMN